MKMLYLLTLFLTISMSLWYPARNDAVLFERIVLTEARAIENQRELPPKQVVRRATRALIAVYDVVSGVVPNFEVRPQAPNLPDTEFEHMDRAGRNALRTPFFRALRSFSMMVLQRYGVIVAAFVLFLPLTLVMIVDGFVHRRIRAAKMQAPRPSLWRGAVTVMTLLVSVSLTLPMVPAMPIEWLVAIPVIGAGALRIALAYWHRFL